MSKKNFAIYRSPLTNRIHVGRVSSDGTQLLNKVDMTNEAVFHVAEHISSRKDIEAGAIVETTDGQSKYQITVTKIS